MTPTLGEGAGTAMMNALALAVALETAPSVPSALEEWEKRERPLTEDTQDCSAQIANERTLSRWDPETSRTANHIPPGTEHFGPLAGIGGKPQGGGVGERPQETPAP